MKETRESMQKPLQTSLMALGLLLIFGFAPILAQTGTLISSVTPSNATPTVGSTITATVTFNMSGVNAPDNKLGSFSASLTWNTAVLSFTSHSGIIAPGFTGVVNDQNTSTGLINFNGANATGTTGNITALVITFTVAGTGTTTLDLTCSALASAITFRNLLVILTTNDGSVTAISPNSPPTATAVAISGTLRVDGVLTGGYTYNDVDGDPQGPSILRWLRNGTEIADASSISYTLTSADLGAMIIFEVTPVAQTGTSPGATAQSAAAGPVEAARYSLEVTSSGNGTVTLSPAGGSYDAGTTVTLTPVPAAGYMFSSWGGANATDVINTGGIYTILLNNNKTLQANFTGSGILGDVNRSTTITSSDALIILSCSVGNAVSQFCPLDCGDVNGTNTITSSDALIVLSYSVGLSVPYPVGQPGCPSGVTPCPGCE